MTAGPEVLVVPPKTFAHTAAERIVAAIHDAVRARRRCAMTLAGGTTPRPVYQALGSLPLRSRLPWLAIDWFFGDERGVPPDDPSSNYRMVCEALFDRAGLPLDRVHRMVGEHTDLEAAARDYEKVLPDPLDVLLLGMGEDGHVASIGPRSPAARERRRRVVPAESPVGVRSRLTITPRVIAAARQVIVLVTGAGKASPVATALAEHGDPVEVPARLARGGLWILDAAAAARLPPPPP